MKLFALLVVAAIVFAALGAWFLALAWGLRTLIEAVDGELAFWPSVGIAVLGSLLFGGIGANKKG